VSTGTSPIIGLVACSDARSRAYITTTPEVAPSRHNRRSASILAGCASMAGVSSEQHPLLPYLVRLEQPYDPEADPTMPTNDVLRFALGWTGSDYWPERTVEWLETGVSAEALQTEWKALVADPKRSQRFDTEP
jgi:hypothetical protein